MCPESLPGGRLELQGPGASTVAALGSITFVVLAQMLSRAPVQGDRSVEWLRVGPLVANASALSIEGCLLSP